MPFTIDKIFTTITAAPSSRTGITEVPPCAALRPYVRCFWETSVHDGAQMRIIPDCCADIMFSADNGKLHGNFCGVSDSSFFANDYERTFGIRFYSWSVALFSSIGASSLMNTYLPAYAVFDGMDGLTGKLSEADSRRERIDIAQKYLLKLLRSEKENSDVMNGIYLAVSRCGRVDVSDLSDYCAVSKRTLEREFRSFTGASPKQMTDMIRYQLLWQDVVKTDFNVLDSVEKFGFYDAAHLYGFFRKFHGIGLSEVRGMF